MPLPERRQKHSSVIQETEFISNATNRWEGCHVHGSPSEDCLKSKLKTIGVPQTRQHQFTIEKNQQFESDYWALSSAMRYEPSQVIT